VTRRLVVAAALAAAAGFHLAALPGHRSPWWFALFFGATAVLQLVGAGLLLLRPTRRVRAVVVLSSLGVLAIWALARTAGLPFGPEAGTRHELGLLDGLCAAVEVAVITGLVLPSSTRWAAMTGGRWRRLALGALVVVFAVSASGGFAVAEPPHFHDEVQVHQHATPHVHAH
jgi:hypothetical protein